LDGEEQASGDPRVGGCFGKSISQPTLGMPDSGLSEWATGVGVKVLPGQSSVFRRQWRWCRRAL
jgi:hypothetical protein